MAIRHLHPPLRMASSGLTMAYADDLLQQARQLAQIDPRRPKQANVRRAVSAAYYAVFHEVVARAVGSVLSGNEASGAVGARLRRVVDHRSVLKSAKWFTMPPRSISPAVQAMRSTSGSEQPPVDPALAHACRLFIRLYEQRHRADYDLTGAFSRDEAIRLIDNAEAAIQTLRALEPRGDALIFLLGCLFGDALTRNP